MLLSADSPVKCEHFQLGFKVHFTTSQQAFQIDAGAGKQRFPLRERGIAEMAFRATGVGTAPHMGTYSFGAKEYAENSGTHSKQKPLDA
ncbi:MAG: hypothetical protein RSC40_09835, partial [Clostridia bacterium]